MLSIDKKKGFRDVKTDDEVLELDMGEVSGGGNKLEFHVEHV